MDATFHKGELAAKGFAIRDNIPAAIARRLYYDGDILRTMTRHCHQCGWNFPRNDQPGRSETCPQCRADLRICLNCTHYDPRVAQQCRERRAEPVHDKQLATYCEYFEMARRDWKAGGANSREDAARDALKRLLGD